MWPLLLGLDTAQLKNDAKEYHKFCVTHDAALKMAEDFQRVHSKYLADRRAWESRKAEAKKAIDDFNAQADDWDALDEHGDRIEKEKTEEPPAPFTEREPVAPESPDFPTSYWDQISKDVDRSLWRQVSEEGERNRRRSQLHRMICAVLTQVRDDEGRELHYFQGYHDIAAVCLLTCDETIGYAILKRLSKTYLRDQMQSKIDYVTSLLHALFPLVTSIDPKIGRVLKKSEVQPFATLPWVMTWFSHVLENQPLSERMFDLFLASPSWMPLYLAASIILYMGDHGLYSCPCEFSEIHNFVSRFCSRTELPWDKLIAKALEYYAYYPPESINAQSYLPTDSYILRYPYPWVPANEVIYKKPIISASTAAVAVIGMAAIGVGVGLAYITQFSHVWGEH